MRPTPPTVEAASLDEAEPGQRLVLSDVAREFGVSVRDLAVVARMPVHQMWLLISTGHWPPRRDPQQLMQAVSQHMGTRGVPTPQLAPLFHTRPAPVPAARPAARRAATIEQEPKVLLAKQTLSPAARKAFKLFSNPFDGEVATEAQMFCNDDIAYVREVCLQTALNARFVAVVGESGAGKTTIQADFEARIQRDSRQVLVIKPSVLGMDDRAERGGSVRSADILAAVISTLDSQARVPQQMQARSRLVAQQLAQSAGAGFLHLLLIEEAHSMPDATLRHLKRLHEMRLGRRPLLGILLLGQPELLTKLDPRRAALREVAQRCEIVPMLPLDDDLGAYLAHRAACAGRRLDEFIDASGLAQMRERLTMKKADGQGKKVAVSLAYPLAINNMMTAALNLAAEIGLPVVTAELMKAA